MLAFGIDPVVLAPGACSTPQSAYDALSASAMRYLRRMDEGVRDGSLPACAGLMTRVRGTGPGVAFGDVVRALETAPHTWSTPFENSANVSGAVIRGAEVSGPERSDAFLLLRFEPGAKDLPLHLHADSDRFIFTIGGRGFFHLSPDPLNRRIGRRIRHIPVRDRDVLMFRRGTVHTFSTAEHPLLLLSYHSPYVPLEDARQYAPTQPPEYPAEFLRGHPARVSFDPAWSVLTTEVTSLTV